MSMPKTGCNWSDGTAEPTPSSGNSPIGYFAASFLRPLNTAECRSIQRKRKAAANWENELDEISPISERNRGYLFARLSAFLGIFTPNLHIGRTCWHPMNREQTFC